MGFDRDSVDAAVFIGIIYICSASVCVNGAEYVFSEAYMFGYLLICRFSLECSYSLPEGDEFLQVAAAVHRII